ELPADDERAIESSPITPERLAGLLKLIEAGTISGKIAKDVFQKMFVSGEDARVIVSREGLTQVADEAALGAVIDRVIAQNPKDEIQVLGNDLGRLRQGAVAALRRSIGVVFQDAKLLPVRTVYENVGFVLRVLGKPRREITQRVFDALRVVGLSSRAQAYPAQLSQGEAQRASLARAIVRKPP